MMVLVFCRFCAVMYTRAQLEKTKKKKKKKKKVW